MSKHAKLILNRKENQTIKVGMQLLCNHPSLIYLFYQKCLGAFTGFLRDEVVWTGCTAKILTCHSRKQTY